MMLCTSSFYALIIPHLLEKKQPFLKRNKQCIKFKYPASIHPTIVAMSQNPVNQQQKVVVPNNHGEKLVGVLHDTGSKEVVIVCHGFTGCKDHKLMINISGALEKEGISAYRFDFSGNGESDGSFAYGNYMKEVEDLCAIVKHFNGANRIISAIVGHSKGGDVVLLYASNYHDVPIIVNLSGRYDLKEGIVERLGEDFMKRIQKNGYIDVECQKTGKILYRVTEESMMERLNTNMHEASLKIDKDCRVLTVHGSADEIIPVKDAYEFSKIIPNHKLHIVEGANHSFSQHQDVLIPVVTNFIKSCIHQDKDS